MEDVMRTIVWTKGAGLGVALAALAAIAGCDTNYYGDSGASRSTTTVTTAPAPLPPSATTTTTVQPNPDGSMTTTERTYRRN
jgi:hypothetical protein